MLRIQSDKFVSVATITIAVGAGLISGCSREQPIHAESQKPRSVTVRPVLEQQLQASLTLPAELLPFESVAIFPKEAGFLEWIGVDRGSRVHKGQVLVRLTAPEVDARQAQGQAQVRTAQSQVDSARAKLASDAATGDHLKAAAKTPGVVAGNDIVVAEKMVEADEANVKAAEESLNAARESLGAYSALQDYLQVKAPFDGVITERNVHPGALVGPPSDSATATPMLRLETVEHLRLVVPVPQAYLSGISTGKDVEFTVPPYANRKFSGKIARISESVTLQTRTMPVELDVFNHDGLLTAGTYAQVQWPIHRTGTSLVVPRTAIASDLEHSFVIRIRNNKTEWVNVQPGLTKGDLSEVFGDLKAGDLVVVRATDELRPDTSVTPVQDIQK